MASYRPSAPMGVNVNVNGNVRGDVGYYNGATSVPMPNGTGVAPNGSAAAVSPPVVGASPIVPSSGVAGANGDSVGVANSGGVNNNGGDGTSSKELWQWDLNSVSAWLSSLTVLHHYPTKTKTPDPAAREAARTVTAALTNNLLTALHHATSGDPATHDTYNILDPSFSTGKDQELTPGSVLSRLGVAALVNGIHGTPGGVHKDPTTHAPPPPGTVSPAQRHYARALAHAVNARVEMDMLESTPRNIVRMLCPDLDLEEVGNIRRRVHATVVMGRGTGSSAQAAALEGEEDAPLARPPKHDMDQFHRCVTCGNNDQANFKLDRKNGDLICTECGTVATESLLHEGSAYRKFEGEADRNHHGDARNPLYSDAHNLGTTIAGLSFQTGAGVGYGSKKQGLEKILRHVHTITEINLSQFGKEEKKTRVGYKDRQKKDAFVKMTHVGDTLSLHEAVVQQAKVLFAGFRDDRELVQQFPGVLAACLWEAFSQLSKDGKQILRSRVGGSGNDDNDGDASNDANGNHGREDSDAPAYLPTRGRRNDMHTVSHAGRDNFDKAKTMEHLEKKEEATTAAAATAAPAVLKDISTWNLDDCRSWFVEASRAVAKNWVEDRTNGDGNKDSSITNATSGTNTSSANPANRTKIPKGSLDELEGQMIGHTLTLCDHLESELAKSAGNNKKVPSANNANKKRPLHPHRPTLTPRVADMSTLGIRWQGRHERGSGGKGGVGNSGRNTDGVKPGENSRTTAGQILLLLTKRRLAGLLVAAAGPSAEEREACAAAGHALHARLQTLRGAQNNRKRKALGEEVALKRGKQLTRKPWLSARAKET